MKKFGLFRERKRKREKKREKTRKNMYKKETEWIGR